MKNYTVGKGLSTFLWKGYHQRKKECRIPRARKRIKCKCGAVSSIWDTYEGKDFSGFWSSIQLSVYSALNLRGLTCVNHHPEMMTLSCLLQAA